MNSNHAILKKSMISRLLKSYSKYDLLHFPSYFFFLLPALFALSLSSSSSSLPSLHIHSFMEFPYVFSFVEANCSIIAFASFHPAFCHFFPHVSTFGISRTTEKYKISLQSAGKFHIFILGNFSFLTNESYD